jgi:hypothetical protein
MPRRIVSATRPARPGAMVTRLPGGANRTRGRISPWIVPTISVTAARRALAPDHGLDPETWLRPCWPDER